MRHIQKIVGRCVDPFDPGAFRLTGDMLPALGTALARVARYNGQSTVSVTGHHLGLYTMMQDEGGWGPYSLLGALLHDIGEIVTGDIPAPIKSAAAGLKGLEHRWWWSFVLDLLGESRAHSMRVVCAGPAFKAMDRRAAKLERAEDIVLDNHHGPTHKGEILFPRTLAAPEAWGAHWAGKVLKQMEAL